VRISGDAITPALLTRMCSGPGSDEGRFWKQRRAFEKKWRDPDDVYIEVEHREEERKKQGLPPRIGIVPHFAVAEDEQRSDGRRKRMKGRGRRRRN
jgi:hypothetical protein